MAFIIFGNTTYSTSTFPNDQRNAKASIKVISLPYSNLYERFPLYFNPYYNGFQTIRKIDYTKGTIIISNPTSFLNDAYTTIRTYTMPLSYLKKIQLLDISQISQYSFTSVYKISNNFYIKISDKYRCGIEVSSTDSFYRNPKIIK